jgi:serine/threonine protein kinase/Leucine-rich repeat (LRR) protein
VEGSANALRTRVNVADDPGPPPQGTSQPSPAPPPPTEPGPTPNPVSAPTEEPSVTPTLAPTAAPTATPTAAQAVTSAPSISATSATSTPTAVDSSPAPTSRPTAEPSTEPSELPTAPAPPPPPGSPTLEPTTQPSVTPTLSPTAVGQTLEPTVKPSAAPTIAQAPTVTTCAPTTTPSQPVTSIPTVSPTVAPVSGATTAPTPPAPPPVDDVGPIPSDDGANNDDDGGDSLFVSRCDTFSSSAGSSVYCAFSACYGNTVVVSSCPSEGGNQSSGVAVYTLYDSTVSLVTSSSLEDNSKCSTLTFIAGSTCAWYNIHQSCLSGSCSAQTIIVNGNRSDVITQQFALLSLGLHVVQSSQSIALGFGWALNDNVTALTGTDAAWNFVTFDDSGNVQSFEYDSSSTVNGVSSKIAGQMDCSALCMLTTLATLVIEDQYLTGSFPTCIGSLSSLNYLSFSGNYLIGSLPAISLDSLEYLSVAGNSLDGTIPTFPSGLRVLDLSSNSLSKSIPSSLTSDYLSIAGIYLSENNFEGPIPLFSSNVSVNVTFEAALNSLTGSIVYSHFQHCRIFNVANNLLTGTLPPFSNETFGVAVDSNFIKGSIPAFGEEMRQFSASTNRLTGTIPPFTELFASFSAGGNSLSGSIPTFLSSLTMFIADSNQLTSTIPALDVALTTFSVSNNKLIGHLPSLSGVALESFSVGGNQLSGPLPSWSSDSEASRRLDSSVSTTLLFFEVSNNHFTGALENFPPALQIVSVGSNYLTGPLPTVLGEVSFVAISNLSQFDISNNGWITGTLPSTLCDWESLYVVMALGNDITCYHACYPQINYLDYMATYTMTNPTRIPNYMVCYNDQVEHLCDIHDALSLAEKVPSSTSSYNYYLAESVSGSLSPVFMSTNSTVDFITEFTYYDKMFTFSQFELSFDLASFAVFTYSVNVYVIINCIHVDGTQANQTTAYFGMPGLGSNAAFSGDCPMLNMIVKVQNPNQLTGTLGTLSFTVDRYAYQTDWDCGTTISEYVINPCYWYGIDCLQNSVVTSITLSNLFLSGSIPDSLGNLTSLATLDLSSNSISGSLPTTIGMLSNVLTTLDISSNQLTEIPTELAKLTSLKVLNVDSNNLHGTLPLYLAELVNLTSLQFRSNAFTGTFPQAVCDLVNLSDSNSEQIFAEDNNFLCESGCEDKIPLGKCFSPSNDLSSGAIAGIVIGSFVFLCFCGFGIWYNRRLYTYKDYPLHLMLLKNQMIDVQHVKQHMSRLGERDKSSRNFLEVLYTRGKLNLITEEALFLAVHAPIMAVIEGGVEGGIEKVTSGRDRLGIDDIDVNVEEINQGGIDVKEAIGDVSSNNRVLDYFEEDDTTNDMFWSWAVLVQQSDDKSFAVVKRILGQEEEHVLLLVNGCDKFGRKCIDIASNRVKDELHKCTYLNRRFELKAGPPEHKSATSMVIFAKDHGVDDGTNSEFVSPTKTGKDTSSPKNSSYVVEPARVALKFMKHRHQFEAELGVRNKAQFDGHFVVAVLDSFDGDQTLSNSVDAQFTKAAQKRGLGDYPYCLLMPMADINLLREMEERQIAGEDWDKIRGILRTLCNCLHHIHGKGVVHGDLKPSNIMFIDNAAHLIDFDASTMLWQSSGKEDAGVGDFAGQKYSSGYLPPELFHDDGGHTNILVKGFTLDENGARARVTYREILVEGVKHIEAVHEVGYTLVRPSAAQDIWALGVVFYQLCTGYALFPCSFEGSVDKEQAKNIKLWTNEFKEEKLSLVDNKYARNLLSLMLSKDPAKRPDAEHILTHPFLSGKRPGRLQGEEPQFDVFLSYRVASDSDHVKMVYEKLTALGLRVWWDAKCLEPGQPWEEGFCNGLANSSCFVCLLSKGAIFDEHKHACNITKLEPTSRCDNVVLEWRLALDLRARGMIEGVFPIFIGNKIVNENDVQQSTVTYSNFFSTGCHPNPLPSVVVNSIETKLGEHLDHQGLGSSLLGRMTIKQIVDEICATQGGFLRGKINEVLPSICNTILEMRQSVRLKQHQQQQDEPQQRRTDSSSPSTSNGNPCPQPQKQIESTIIASRYPRRPVVDAGQAVL